MLERCLKIVDKYNKWCQQIFIVDNIPLQYVQTEKTVSWYQYSHYVCECAHVSMCVFVREITLGFVLVLL